MTTEIIIRNVDIIAAEINSIKDQTRKIVLGNSIEIGKRLVEAKDIVPHGEWGNWLLESVAYSQSTANNLMRIFNEYGANQMSLFGSDAKSQAIGNLSYTQAVALLGIPSEEREAFIEENNIDEMSTRELQTAIKEKQELEKRLKESEDAAELERAERQKIEAQRIELESVLEKKIESHNNLVERMKKQIKDAKKSGNNDEVETLQTSLEQSETDLETSRARITELEEQLAIPAEIPEATQKELDTLRQRETELSELAKRLEVDAQKQISDLQEQIRKNNNTAGIKVKLYFHALTTNFNELVSSIIEIENEEQKTAVKARIAALCDEMKDKL